MDAQCRINKGVPFLPYMLAQHRGALVTEGHLTLKKKEHKTESSTELHDSVGESGGQSSSNKCVGMKESKLETGHVQAGGPQQ